MNEFMDKPCQLKSLNQMSLLPGFSSLQLENLCALERIERVETVMTVNKKARWYTS